MMSLGTSLIWGLDFVDICDDYDATEEILSLDREAADKDILEVTGFE